MDTTPTLTFQDILDRWDWRPIKHCPGRFILPLSEGHLSFEELLGQPYQPHCYHTEAAPDPVLVLDLQGGGLISYRKPDGRLLHTLNTMEGFLRKLRQLKLLPENRSLPAQ